MNTLGSYDDDAMRHLHLALGAQLRSNVRTAYHNVALGTNVCTAHHNEEYSFLPATGLPGSAVPEASAIISASLFLRVSSILPVNLSSTVALPYCRRKGKADHTLQSVNGHPTQKCAGLGWVNSQRFSSNLCHCHVFEFTWCID